MRLTRPSREQLKFCAKMGLAAALAYLFTQGDRNQHALYAVFTAALVLGSNVGEDLVSSWNRVAGTVMGAVTGMVVAVLIGPSASAVAVGTALTVLGTMSVGLGLPAARIGATMCVVLLMTHVDDATRYSLLRLANTALGIVVGLAVSFLVWPVRGADAVTRAVREVLAASAEVLGAVRMEPWPRRRPPSAVCWTGSG